jgi:hypothetical protein
MFQDLGINFLDSFVVDFLYVFLVSFGVVLGQPFSKVRVPWYIYDAHSL